MGINRVSMVKYLKEDLGSSPLITIRPFLVKESPYTRDIKDILSERKTFELISAAIC